MKCSSRRFIVIALTIIGFVAQLSAQRQRNYIYLFDCTQSMQEKGLWTPARTALDKTIERQRTQDGSRFTVIPFQGRVYSPIRFSGDDYPKAKQTIDKDFDSYILQRTNTNIIDVFRAGMKECDPMMDNRVYLLTDGLHNMPGQSIEDVCREITRWCDDHKNTRFFYVTLDGVASHPKLDEALRRCSDAFGVKCSGGVIPQMSDIDDNIYANTLELDKIYRKQFSEPGTYPLRHTCNDPYFDVEIVGDKVDDQTIDFRFRIRGGLSMEELNERLKTLTDERGNYIFTFEVTSADKDMVVVNPTITVVMANRPQRTLTINNGSLDEGIVKPGASWYPSFLWSDEKPREILTFDLRPEFNNAAGAATSCTLSVESADGEPDDDYTVYFNGSPVGDDGKFTIIPGGKAEVGIMFDTDAKTGKRYFKLEHEGSTELEIINGIPSEQLDEIPFRTTYERDWNPLATLLFWIGIVLLGALILWFLIVKRMIYPTFNLSSLEFDGPDGYYLTKRIRGARAVRLVNGRKNQGILSRIFTGRVIYIRADHWTPEVEIVPGRRRTAHVHPGKAWDVIPSSLMERYETYELINGSSKTKITVN